MLSIWLLAGALAGDPTLDPDRDLTFDLTLGQALDEALVSNLELRRAGLSVGVTELSLARARSAFDPRLGLSASSGQSNSPNNEVIAGQDVLTNSSRGFSASLDPPATARGGADRRGCRVGGVDAHDVAGPSPGRPRTTRTS